MALNGSDNLLISRAGNLYKILASDVLAYITDNIGTSDYKVADITARNALGTLSAGDTVMVDNATGDGTVTAGWALYQYISAGVWRKIAEQESLDISVGSTNLSYTAGASSGIVVSSTGEDATLPAVNGTEAGLMLPAHKTKLDFVTVTAAFDADATKTKLAFITVTQAVDLDAMETASHAAATTAGSAATNPVTISGQAINFSIAGLTSAP